MKLFLRVVAGLLAVMYPFAIYFGLKYFEPKYLGLLLCVILVLRYFSGMSQNDPGTKKQTVFIGILGLIIIGFSVLSNSIDGLKFYPVLINFSMLLTFLHSLRYPPTAIERLARIREPELSEDGVKYTRSITKLWCVLFLINTFASIYTSLFSSIEVWTLYNGFIAYLLIGALFVGELIFRSLFLKKGVR